MMAKDLTQQAQEILKDVIIDRWEVLTGEKAVKQ